MKIKAAGGVVYRQVSRELIEVVIGKQANGDWRLPKGVSEPGETAIQTAKREVGEETGLSVQICGFIGETTYAFKNSIDGAYHVKSVTFYLMFPTGGEISIHDVEFECVSWVEWREALRRLTFSNEAGILEAAASMVGTIHPVDS